MLSAHGPVVTTARLLRAAVTGPHRLRGAAIGAGSYVSPRAVLREHARIRLGRHTAVGRHVELLPQGGSITVGDDCSLHNFVMLYGAGGITVGDGCRIATGALIVAFNHGFADPDLPIRHQPITARGVVVGDDVWIGARAVLLDGVRVGHGGVVGAGAVVTRDVPDRCVVVGNPARVVRRRGDGAARGSGRAEAAVEVGERVEVGVEAVPVEHLATHPIQRGG